MSRPKIKLEEFIQKANEVHQNKYSYDKVTLDKSQENVIITCPIHGDFLQRFYDHLYGHGCVHCNGKQLTTQLIIQSAIHIHGNKFSYDKLQYTNDKTKIIVTCPTHGDFTILPRYFLKGHGCRKCNNNTLQKLIQKANEVHNNKYSYEKTKFVNWNTHILVTCPIHGDFLQLPNNHIRNHGCQQCASTKKTGRISKKENICQIQTTSQNS